MAWNGALPAGVGIVHHQPDLDDQRAAFGRFVEHAEEFQRRVQQAGKVFENGNGGGKRFDQVRRVLDEQVAFAHRLAHKTELAVLEVTDAAVRHVRGSRRPAGTKVRAFDQQHIHTVQGEFAEHANPVDAAADDQHGNFGVFPEMRENFLSVHR
jgi:hypothetical protein